MIACQKFFMWFHMPDTVWTMPVSIAAFVVAAPVITVSGVMITVRAEHLAQRTGLGQAIMGAVFIGAATSLSGLFLQKNITLNSTPNNGAN